MCGFKMHRPCGNSWAFDSKYSDLVGSAFQTPPRADGRIFQNSCRFLRSNKALIYVYGATIPIQKGARCVADNFRVSLRGRIVPAGGRHAKSRLALSRSALQSGGCLVRQSEPDRDDRLSPCRVRRNSHFGPELILTSPAFAWRPRPDRRLKSYQSQQSRDSDRS